MNRRHLAAALIALSLSLPLLPGCGRGKGSATPQAAQELAEMRAEQELGFTGDADSELQAEIAALLTRFEKTADARLASSPHAITMLHLACVYKKTELARCLLQDGADPNARQLTEAPSAEMDDMEAPPLADAHTPLTWATIPHREGATAEEMLPLINLLVENGADVNGAGPSGAPPLVTSTVIPTPAAEAVFIRLLELGARCPEFCPPEGGGQSLPLAALVAENGWAKALAALLDTGAPMATAARSALHAAAGQPGAGALECARLLLERGAEIDALDDEGATPLYLAAHCLSSPEARELCGMENICQMLALLLQHGADPLRCCDADPEYPGSSASDFIAMSHAAQQQLAAMGITVPRRPANFEAEGDAFLAEICRASLFGATAEEIAPHFAAIAALAATPTHEQEHSAFYADAVGHAVKLLARADAARTAELVAQLPLWRAEEEWKSASTRPAALLEAVLSTPELILPRTMLVEQARRLDAWGVAEAAALLIELLERDAAAGADIEALCADASPAIRAGALTARLLRAGLPAPRNGAVAEWMKEHALAEDSAPAALERALLLTSLDAFWYGEMTAEKTRALLDAMRSIGAPGAAAFYAELAPNLGNPEELERLTAPGGAAEAARYELECATALFLWSQREALLQLIPPSPAPALQP